MTRALPATLLAGVLALTATRSACAAPPSDAEIRKMLAGRADPEHGVGIVVGITGPGGHRIIATDSFNGDTAFEIGSVTKVFTALLLADMVERGEVVLAEPAAKYLPAGTMIPERNGRPITLADLATHTSALPFMPDDVNGTVSAAQLYAFLAGTKLTRDAGTEWDYSNVGYWLLSEALAARAGTDYETLLRRRVLEPLRLHDTSFTLSPKLRKALAPGHDTSLQPAPAITSLPAYAAMPAAGLLVSTGNDLLTFLDEETGTTRSPLRGAMARMLTTQRPGPKGDQQALGWLIAGVGDDRIVFHDGGTLGYASCIAWDPKTREGVVVLSNQLGDVADIARHLLRPSYPLAPPPARTKHTEIGVDPAILDTYAGRYEIAEEGTVTIARDGDHLTIAPPPGWGLPDLRLRPESTHDFFVAEVPLHVTFQTVTDGQVTGLLLQPPRGQHVFTATRTK